MKACPAGWHLPSSKEWCELFIFVGGEDIAGMKLKSKSPDWDGTDDYWFSALPSGSYDGDDRFISLGWFGNGWWSATPYDTSFQFISNWGMGTGSTSVGEGNIPRNFGFSVRCLRD
jgi:uncharacterized protein (TIGR02145 family)